ncbi:hypothetical protein MVES_003240 [Malassezia vespertilionis]|uniref:Uncharacterized protein n=1 Tax=Malassezia vespertilionis TaxID=2020962 RepID=A0A2N1J8I6_9BASI|nr:hypothetical protein MVES_003240 [Malassezia vespertilionis]
MIALSTSVGAFGYKQGEQRTRTRLLNPAEVAAAARDAGAEQGLGYPLDGDVQNALRDR